MLLVQNAADDVPGGLRFVGRDGDLLTDDRIGQRGFTGIRPTDKTGKPGTVNIIRDLDLPAGRLVPMLLSSRTGLSRAAGSPWPRAQVA
ncbi:hypothetical protein AB0C29_31965 [Actinoplanes sp. NPDC048791]|uniref:hypothetical protein n=1 Tax=Actinoplanes sp. NPDC048791 TaxID=3154623 RepID=UPI0033C5BACE